MNQDRKNADRYLTAKHQLRERKLDLDIYRKKIISGDNEALQEFFEPVFVTLKSDHDTFLEIAEEREFAIGGMEKRLNKQAELVEEKP